MQLQPLDTDPELGYESAGLDIVDKEFIESQISLWDTALSTRPPQPDAEPEVASRFQLSEVMTAPRVESQEIEPVRTYYYDGFDPVEDAALVRTLQDAARQVVRASIQTDAYLVDPGGFEDARRVYVFSTPVQEAQSVEGELFMPGKNGFEDKQPYTPGTPTTILIEVLPFRIDEATSAKTKRLRCDVKGARATWHPADDA